MKPLRFAAAAMLLLVALAGRGAVIDDFESPAAWTAHPSDGVELAISPDAGLHGRAMRLDFDFHQHGGYAIARRNVDLDLPANYEIVFSMRADAPVNNLELKLIDASGENVWWLNRRDFTFPRKWKEIATRKRQITFAWGPAGGGELRHVAAMEIVVTAGTGGRGSVWIDDLVLTELPPTATGAVRHGSWRAPEGTAPLRIDLGGFREIGGLRLKWDQSDFARDYSVALSRDGEHFESVREVRDNGRADSFLYLPEEEARAVRLTMLRSSRGRGYALESVEVEPVGWAPTANDFFARVAGAARRGAYPRYLAGEQPYWTVAGAAGAEAEALVGEDGNVEPFKGGFSLEPFLEIDGRLVTWRDARISQSLAQGDLPIPSVRWRADGAELVVTAAVTESSMLLLRYSITRSTAKPVSLFVTVRPFQVNPSTQFLNTQGGVSPIRTIRLEKSEVVVNGDQPIEVMTPPARFVASTYDQGEIVDLMRSGRQSTAVEDPAGYASAALSYPVSRGTTEVFFQIPLQQGALRESDVNAAIARVTAGWRETLGRVTISIPAAPEIGATIRSNLAYTLIQRDGAALEPGSRSYDRAWIRDGALISSGLLRLRHDGEARAFAEWFAPYQFDDGKVPCCVDRRGADPVPENDSHGELIFLVAEIHRYTGDLELVRKLWPHVDAAARYIARLRSENHGPFEGLVTESISHEGYSARPVHSYWDDFFCLKGVQDAAYLAGVLHLDARQRELEAEAASFRRDLQASMERTAREHGIDYLPASAELGDFDPTSTSIAVSPLELMSVLPQRELRRTFDRYLLEIEKPRELYTPYEMRIVGAMIRFGDRASAMRLLDRFLRDRRPAGWNQWAEVVGRELRQPRFIGDMPHVWIASDFIRAILDGFAYDREDGALVVGGGIPRKWLAKGPLHVGPLATYGGPIDIRMRDEGDRIVVDLDGSSHLRNIVVRSPADQQEVTLQSLPAQVVFEVGESVPHR